DQATLTGGVQAQLAALEAAVSGETRTDDDLLVVDGPLRGRQHLPRALGYVKTHRVEYLPAELTAVVTPLRAGQRTPVSPLGTSGPGSACSRRPPARAGAPWRLALRSAQSRTGWAGAPWAGIVRAECPAELAVAAAVELADRSTVTLPRFASTPYKDPRA